MIDPTLIVDSTMSQFFASPRFRKLEPSSMRSYTTSYRVFFNFLWTRGMTWRDADVDAIEDYEDWRRRAPQNPSHVAGTTFKRELAALGLLYHWAQSRGFVAGSPLLTRVVRLHDGSVRETYEASPKNTQRRDVKWLTPRAFKLWLRVGLEGMGVDAAEDPAWRGRNSDRNAGYAQLLFDSGLRRTEAASLLTFEIPEADNARRYVWSRVGAAATKTKHGRAFPVQSKTAKMLETYRISRRAGAIRRAQAAHRYDRVSEKLVVVSRTLDSLTWKDDAGNGATSKIANVRVAERLRLYEEANGSLEPLWFWLSEDGLPFLPDSWENVFRAANVRVAATGMPSPPFMRPHMARHSFALIRLVHFMGVFDKRFQLAPEDRVYFRQLYGDAWLAVQSLLGHASPDVTRDIYLAPVQEILGRTLIEYDEEDLQGLVHSLLSRSPRVLDTVE
ncbi:site-specific integrase [Frondihabitans cladoniiphilus]